ncbi:hypothetical protein [Synechococcus sp. CCY9202]|uniref:hypothetical protein n=1 Tax=Synechococcus sp. CCY9202 TaxID=174698 RepID=UPI002B2031FF|nr:hypothetical protein [Synechococcus sp. CCY9202]MEA5423218.1 hypothetical protein [Synechococcus sp. CCY9202]
MLQPEYFIRIDGVFGDTQFDSSYGAGWFRISAHDLDVLTGLSFEPEGIRTGSPDFSSITVELELGSSVSLFKQVIADTQRIDSLQIVGVVNASSKVATVYDLRLADVRLTGLGNQSDNSAQLNLDYERFGISTTPQLADGTFGKIQTYAYDRITGNEILFGSLPVPPILSDSLSRRSASASEYWLKMARRRLGSARLRS